MATSLLLSPLATNSRICRSRCVSSDSGLAGEARAFSSLRLTSMRAASAGDT